MMETAWGTDLEPALLRVYDTLGEAMLLSISVPGTGPFPIVETILRLWDEVLQQCGGIPAAVENAFLRALARAWVSYPLVTENYLEDYPDLGARVQERTRDHAEEWNRMNTAASLVGLLFFPATVPGLICVVEEICDSITDAREALQKMGEHMIDPKTISAVAQSLAATQRQSPSVSRDKE